MPTAAQVAETSVSVNSSPIQDYTHMNDHAGSICDMALRLKSPFTTLKSLPLYFRDNQSFSSITHNNLCGMVPLSLVCFLDLMLSSDFMKRKEAIDTFNKMRMSSFLRLIVLVSPGPDN